MFFFFYNVYRILSNYASLCRTKDKTDLDVVRENHRFLWKDEDEEDMTWYIFISFLKPTSSYIIYFRSYPLTDLPFQGERAGEEVL